MPADHDQGGDDDDGEPLSGDLHLADDQRPDDRLRDGDIKVAGEPAYTPLDYEPENIGAEHGGNGCGIEMPDAVETGLAGLGGRIRIFADRSSPRLSARGGRTRTCASRLKVVVPHLKQSLRG
jgi:hypothetical protein